jgi:hypothetical protein
MPHLRRDPKESCPQRTVSVRRITGGFKYRVLILTPGQRRKEFITPEWKRDLQAAGITPTEINSLDKSLEELEESYGRIQPDTSKQKLKIYNSDPHGLRPRD